MQRLTIFFNLFSHQFDLFRTTIVDLQSGCLFYDHWLLGTSVELDSVCYSRSTYPVEHLSRWLRQKMIRYIQVISLFATFWTGLKHKQSSRLVEMGLKIVRKNSSLKKTKLRSLVIYYCFNNSWWLTQAMQMVIFKRLKNVFSKPNCLAANVVGISSEKRNRRWLLELNFTLVVFLSIFRWCCCCAQTKHTLEPFESNSLEQWTTNN